MRWWLIVASLWLVAVISLCEEQTRARNRSQPHGGAHGRGKRRKSGQGRTRGDRAKPKKQVPGHSAPLNHLAPDGTVLFIDSYKSLGEPRSSYKVIPGKEGQCVYQGIKMFDQAVWSPKPCVTCLCTGGQVVCDEVVCPPVRCHFPFIPAEECCPVCMEQVPDLSDFSGDSPVPRDPSSDLLPHPGEPPHTLEEIQRIIWREEEEHREEEERLRRREERRRKKKEEAERKRQLEVEERIRKIEEEEERRRLEEEEERRQKVEEERRRLEEEERRQKEEEERRRLEEEEDRKLKEAAEKKAREKEKKLEEERRRQEELLREKLKALEELEGEEEEEEEEEVWLRGDVFSMLPKEPEEPDLLPAPIPKPPEEDDEEEDEEREVRKPTRAGLPPGCDISDVIVTCENAKLIHFPALALPEVRSLSLEGNNIRSIPDGAFNGLPNLNWINLGKNRLTSSGIAPKVFRSLKQLNRLYLDGNLLEEIPPDLPPTLQELKINENQLKSIDRSVLQDLSSLVILELEGNLLSEGNVAPEAFAGLMQLTYLRMGRNHFRTIPQGLPPTLLELYLENNLIEEITESAFNLSTNLNVISLRHNRLEESRIAPMAWINHRNLESIDLAHNQFYLVPSYLPRSLVHLILVGNQIERIPGFVFAHMEPGIEYLYLSYNKLDGDGFESESFFGAFNSMVELCLDHNQLISVPSGINEMSSLHFLRLNNNNIRSIPEDSICDPLNEEDAHLVSLRLENNYINLRKIAPTAFSCVRSYSSVVLKPQKIK